MDHTMHNSLIFRLGCRRVCFQKFARCARIIGVDVAICSLCERLDMGRSSVRVGWSATRGSNGPRGSNTRAFRVGGFVIRLFSLVTFHNRMVGVFLSVRPQTQIVSAFRVVNSGSRMSAGRSVQVCTNTSCKKVCMCVGLMAHAVLFFRTAV